MRKFNTTGPCFPDEHYMLPALDRLPGIREKSLDGFSSRLLMLRGNSTQTAFSASIGVVKQTYAQWELGNRQPKLQELVRLVQHFNVSTDWLLGLTDVKVQPQNANIDHDLLLRLAVAESELRRYKTAFGKITKSLKTTVEVIEELQEDGK